VIQSDNGSGFISREFAQVLREHAVTQHRIQPHTPEQNAFVERVFRTLGERLDAHELDAVGQARSAIAEIIDWYNHTRLHGELRDIPPVEYEQAHLAVAGDRPAEARAGGISLRSPSGSLRSIPSPQPTILITAETK